eukprot:12982420-Heterocapsa_arctica.AAC.1
MDFQPAFIISRLHERGAQHRHRFPPPELVLEPTWGFLRGPALTSKARRRGEGGRPMAFRRVVVPIRQESAFHQ